VAAPCARLQLVRRPVRNGGRGRPCSTESLGIMRSAAVVVIAAFIAASFAACASAEALYRREVNQRNPGGKDLVMSVEELRRDSRTSEIKLTFRSGASVPSSMFVVRAFYDIALERHAKYFVKLREREAEDGATIFLVGFTQSDRVDPKQYFGVPDVESGVRFMSVEMYRPIFGNEK